MITFIISVIALLIMAVIIAATIIVGGAGFILLFGDLIVCALIIYLIVRAIRQRR